MRGIYRLGSVWRGAQFCPVFPVCAQLEAAAATHSEPTPELEKKVKAMSVDKLRMERLIAKLYSVSLMWCIVAITDLATKALSWLHSDHSA